MNASQAWFEQDDKQIAWERIETDCEFPSIDNQSMSASDAITETDSNPFALEPHYPIHSAFDPSSNQAELDETTTSLPMEKNQSSIHQSDSKTPPVIVQEASTEKSLIAVSDESNEKPRPKEGSGDRQEEKETAFIDFKEAKSHTRLLKKANVLKGNESFNEAVGKQTIATPTVGAIDFDFSSDASIAEKDADKARDNSTTTNRQMEEFQSNASSSILPVSFKTKEMLAQIDNDSATSPLVIPDSPPESTPESTPALKTEHPTVSEEAPTGQSQENPQAATLTTPNSTNAISPLERAIPSIAPAQETRTQPSFIQRPLTNQPPLINQSTPAPTGDSTTLITPTSTETIIQTRPNHALDAESSNNGFSPQESTSVAQQIKEISINFNNVAMVEFIRFISRISNKNFIFDETDLQFNVTIVSEEPTSIENLMSALLQELRIRDLSLIEQGNNIIIHRNPRIRAPARIVAEGISAGTGRETELVTQVFRLNTLDPLKASEIIRPLLSDDALVEVLRDTNNLIITDLVANVNKISQLINSLDAPNSGMIIGQYAVRNAFVDSLTSLAEKILLPIAQGNPFTLVPHPATNSIFVVSNPFIVERALAILENLDMNEGRTKIFTLEKLRLSNQDLLNQGLGGPGGRNGLGGQNGQNGLEGQGGQGQGGQGQGLNGAEGAEGAGANGGFGPGVPLGPEGQPLPASGFGIEGLLTPGAFPYSSGLAPGGLSSNPRWIQELPPGHIERTLFFIYKLKYRRGDQIEIALRRIGESLILTGTSNEDLISSINSIQWLESSNSLIFTGTVMALDRIKELIEEIDVALRQVFIEMLILDTTITDSLSYGVDWGTRFGGGETAGGQAFLGAGSVPLLTGLDSVLPSTAPGIRSPGPVSTALNRSQGFSLGVIGRHLTHNGLLFNSIGALVTAIHDDAKANIIMNPKIITEDNNTAEIFVGSTDRFKTQSISNDLGNVITNNFQFIDVGTTLRVTPLIGNNDVITLDIVEEITNDSGGANPVGTNSANVDVNLIPVLSKSRTLTRVHVPNGFFIVLSGMIHDTRSRTISQVPCLGGIPIIGGSSKQKRNLDTKRNLMIFIRPVLVDTDDELENITKRQQDIYREKSKFRRSWNYEIDEALDFFNFKRTDPDEIGCTIK